MKHTILCVDDEIDNVEALERLFRKKYNVLKATSGAEALEVLRSHGQPVSLIITDQRMPEMTGVEFLQKTIEQFPDTVRILLTGYTDIESVIEAVNNGQIFRYLTKPWDPIDLGNTVDRAIEKYSLRTELHQKNFELARALEELQSLDKAKSNFMLLINHELKTPLTSILNFLSLLQESSQSEDQAMYTDRIQRAAIRLKILIDDVLLIVKSETGQLHPRMAQGVINQYDTWMHSDIRLQLQKRNMKVQDRMQALPIEADLSLIKQVIQRLVHNAAKFGMESSEVFIENMVIGKKIRFIVHNKGPQIPSKVIEKIYQPFYIDEDIMHHSTGMGLGLTICQAILHAHGSALELKNTDHGVMVYFDLRLE